MLGTQRQVLFNIQASADKGQLPIRHRNLILWSRGISMEYVNRQFGRQQYVNE